jgi:hypothetical protein
MTRMFKVEIAVQGDTTYVVPLRTAIDAWIGRVPSSDAATLPAAQIESGEPDAALRLRLTWIEVEAAAAWDAMTLAVARLREGCPALVDHAVQLDISAEIHDPRPDYRRPRGT